MTCLCDAPENLQHFDTRRNNFRPTKKLKRMLGEFNSAHQRRCFIEVMAMVRDLGEEVSLDGLGVGDMMEVKWQ